MNHVTLSDFLTDAEIKQAFAICKTVGPHKQLVDFLTPKMNNINKKLGQENDSGYLAYGIEYAYSLKRN